MSKSAFVALAGRPSAGKSTLVNALCGAKVSIVSPVPQTTRNAVRGIVNRAEGQLVLLDTPGFHLSDKRFNQRLRDVSTEAYADADIVLYLIDATRASGAEEAELAKALASAASRLVVAINKIDLPAADAAAARLLVSERFPAAPVFELSALQGTGLEALVAELYRRSPEGPAWYPEEYYTDQEPVFRIAEIIREKVLLHTRDELPHAVYVSYKDSSRAEDGSLIASYDLVVERDSQKGILIGSGGAMIKRLREESEADLAAIFDYAVHLRLSVRVDANWRKDEKRLRNLIF
ncbi:MAG TPA: GTPase Era [Rectinemataceae bacterium]|nr:GTPase Era [Rectinemataceae bacterium]